MQSKAALFSSRERIVLVNYSEFVRYRQACLALLHDSFMIMSLLTHSLNLSIFCLRELECSLSLSLLKRQPNTARP